MPLHSHLPPSVQRHALDWEVPWQAAHAPQELHSVHVAQSGPQLHLSPHPQDSLVHVHTIFRLCVS